MKKRPDGLYQKAVRLPSGKKKIFYARTQAELNRKILAYQYEADQGRLFEQVADQWQEKHDSTVRYKTREACVAPTARCRAYFEGRRIKDISAPEIAAYVRYIEQMGLSKRTVQLHRDVLSMIFDYAIGSGKEILVNPCATVSLSPGLKQTSRELPDRSDIEAIKAHCQDDRFSLLPYLLLYTGLRLGEALALRREDFTQDEIRITKKVLWPSNQPVVEDFLKTKRGTRVVPLLDVLRDVLPEWEGYLWGGDKPLSKTIFRREWAKYAVRTGVKCDRQSLRHEFVTFMYEAGLDAPAAAEITGHDITVMEHVYLHIREDKRKESAAKLNDFAKR